MKKLIMMAGLWIVATSSGLEARTLTVPAENNSDTACLNSACAISSISACTNAGSYPCCDTSGTCTSLRSAIRQAVLYESEGLHAI